MKIKKSPVVVRDETVSHVYAGLRLHLCMINILIALMLSSCSTQKSADSPADRPSTHTVNKGDTLFSIAWRYGIKYEALAKYNGISKPYLIKPKQVIRLNVPVHMLRATPAQASVRPIGTRQKVSEKGKVQNNSRKKNQTKLTPKINSSQAEWSAPVWSWPVSGSILSSFQGNNGLNKGIDLGGKLGEPVLAAASGEVVYSGSGLRGYGKLLIIKHNETFLSAYAHNHRLLVNEGDVVKAGQKIADMGSSGTDRVKLHFEIRRDGTPVDPLKFLPRR